MATAYPRSATLASTPFASARRSTLGKDPFDFCDAPTDGSDLEVTPDMVAAALGVIPLPPPLCRSSHRTAGRSSTSTRTSSPDATALTVPSPCSASAWTCTSCRARSAGGSGTVSRWRPTTRGAVPEPRGDPPLPRRRARSRRAWTRRTPRRSGSTAGPWRDVPGSVTIAGPPVDLQVLTATPTLVGYD